VHLDENPDVFGAAFAFVPFEKESRIIEIAPYVYREDDTVVQKVLPAKYNYTSTLWYIKPVQLREPVWSEPYYDEGGAGADVLMTTYSVPVYNEDGKLIGVLTGDLLIKKGE